MKYLINCSISAKNFFDSVKTSIIGALLKYEKLVEKDAILVHDRVIRAWDQSLCDVKTRTRSFVRALFAMFLLRCLRNVWKNADRSRCRGCSNQRED